MASFSPASSAEIVIIWHYMIKPQKLWLEVKHIMLLKALLHSTSITWKHSNDIIRARHTERWRVTSSCAVALSCHDVQNITNPYEAKTKHSCSPQLSCCRGFRSRICTHTRYCLDPERRSCSMRDVSVWALRKLLSACSEKLEYPIPLSIVSLVSTHTSLIGQLKHREYWVHSIWQLSEMWEKRINMLVRSQKETETYLKCRNHLPQGECGKANLPNPVLHLWNHRTDTDSHTAFAGESFPANLHGKS